MECFILPNEVCYNKAYSKIRSMSNLNFHALLTEVCVYSCEFVEIPEQHALEIDSEYHLKLAQHLAQSTFSNI